MKLVILLVVACLLLVTLDALICHFGPPCGPNDAPPLPLEDSVEAARVPELDA